jgi:RHS repeat-associated protein
MLLPKRHGAVDGYRYGFQGQEKDDEIKGEGNSLNYKFRMYDPRIGRFFAEDPLVPQYPELTPYQFASNSPVFLNELEGLEGQTYLKTIVINGEQKIRRVIEADVYVAISRDNNSNHYYSKKESKDEKIAERVQKAFSEDYINGKFKDKDGHDIYWVFNVKTFLVDDKGTADTFTREYKADFEKSLVTGTLNGQPKTGFKGFILEKTKLSELPSFNPDTGELSNVLEGSELGVYDGLFTVRVNDEYAVRGDESNTINHEVAHFFLRYHPNENVKSPANSAKLHNEIGGILTYYKYNYIPKANSVRTGNQDSYTLSITRDVKRQTVTQDNVDLFLESIPDTTQD